jgi:HD-GYP domain-containing protein (c-di-GMP phosphodiesterase class II)
VSNTSLKLQSQIPTVLNKAIAVSPDAAWDVLERFGQSLQQCDQAAQQVRLVLEAVQESLAADVVFWFPGSDTDAPETVGQPCLSVEWRRNFICHEIAKTAGNQGQLVRSFLDPSANPPGPWPCSAAMVRLRESCGSWLVALSFHPRRIFLPLDLKVMRLARRLLLNHRQHRQVHEQLRGSLFGLVSCLTAAIDAKDPATLGHSERVGRLAVRLGKQMGLPQGTLSDLYLAGLLHDIGKAGVRDNVLQKPGQLSKDELAHVQQHPVIGDQLVANLRQLHHLRPGVRNHHERWDGRGYPDKLAGDEIPLLARILAVAESCDAMMMERPYRPAMPPARIEAELRAGMGRQWDPKIIELFLVCKHELYSICQRGLGDAVSLAVEHEEEE